MASEKRNRIVNFFIKSSAFATIFRRLRGDRSEYDFSALQELRQLLSNEKAKILSVVETSKPESVYKLSRILERDFKSVWKDIKLLEKFGLVELKPEKQGNRKRLKPSVIIDNLQINISFQ